MKKKRIIKAGVLTIIFLLAILISSFITNYGNNDARIDLGDPTLPRVSFLVKGEEVNHLQGYVDEMNVVAMRDTITPIEKNGNLQMQIQADGNKISEIFYDVYSMDGTKIYASGKVKDFTQENATLKLSKALKKTEMEAVLRVGLELKKRTVYFYTRIIRPTELSVIECLEHARTFHEHTFLGKDKNEVVEKELAPDGSGDPHSFQHVTLASDISNVTWREMKPDVLGTVEWSIQEANSVYTSLLATYQVSVVNDKSRTELYNVREFYRVRSSEEGIYLQNFDRTIEQVFDADPSSFTKDGIRLGTVSQDIQIVENKKKSFVAFVVGRDLWSYDVSGNKIALVFSFANREGHDKRGQYAQHSVQIINQDQEGNLVFVVYGYMNRGRQEGRVGADVYYYDVKKNTVQEKAFIPSDKSFMMAKQELGDMIYYDHTNLLLYILSNHQLLKVDIEKNKQKIIAEDIKDGEYAISEDNHLLAFLESKSNGRKEIIKVMNLKTGADYEVKAEKEQRIQPLGFIDEDFIYGLQKEEDQSKSLTGDTILPMYEIRIVNKEGKIIKQYSEENTYIQGVEIVNDQVTIHRVKKVDGQYVDTEPDYISCSEEKVEADERLGYYYTEEKGNQSLLKLNRGKLKNTVKILRPKQEYGNGVITLDQNNADLDEKFYVYALGTLQGIYLKAGDAIQKAEEQSGVVISDRQSYVWQKGNRLLACDTPIDDFEKKENQSSLEAVEAYMQKFGGVKTDLTGSRLDQIFYVVNLGRPVIALMEKDHAVLITGYDLERVYYLDPNDEKEHSIYVSDMEAKMEAQGNIYIGYLE